MKRTIKLKTVLPYSPQKVWLALTDSQLLGTWFMENNIVPKLNQEFTFKMAAQKGWDGITYCKITALEPIQHIAYT